MLNFPTTSLNKLAKEFVDIYFETAFDNDKVADEIVVGAEEYDLKSFDNHKLRAYGINTNDGDKYIISVCDYRKSVNDLTDFVREFNNDGINNIVISQRLDPNFITRSVYDLALFLNYFVEKNPNMEIILYGEGFGANTIVKYLNTKPLINIKACILDDIKPLDILDKFEEFTNKKQIINKTLFRFYINSILNKRFSYEMNDLKLKDMLKNNSIPLLFIYNKQKEDYKEVLRLFNSTKGDKKFFYSNEFDRNQNQDNYYMTLKSYINNFFNNQLRDD